MVQDRQSEQQVRETVRSWWFQTSLVTAAVSLSLLVLKECAHGDAGNLLDGLWLLCTVVTLAIGLSLLIGAVFTGCYRHRLLIAPAIAFLSFVAAFAFLPCEYSGRVPCASNLKQVGMGIMLYAHDHGGKTPASLEILVAEGYVSEEVLSCPVFEFPGLPPGSRIAAFMARQAGTRNPSYIYIVPGRIAGELSPDEMVAYEPPANHGGQGAYVLFGDGHVEWHFAGDMRELVAATTRPAKGN